MAWNWIGFNRNIRVPRMDRSLSFGAGLMFGVGNHEEIRGPNLNLVTYDELSAEENMRSKLNLT